MSSPPPPSKVSDTKKADAGEDDFAPLLPSSLLPPPAATAVSFHPLLSQYALAGYENGSVALFSTAHAAPLKVWAAPWASSAADANKAAGASRQQQRHQQHQQQACVIRLLWIPSRPCCFIAVDEQACVAVFDLLVNTTAPLIVQTMSPGWGAAAAGGAIHGGDDGGGRKGPGGGGGAVVVAAAELIGGTPLAPRSLSLCVTFAGGGVSALLPFERSFLVTRQGEAQRAREIIAGKLL